ncbi:polymeric immunoglobulin receptor-like [Phyllobates terribilis]|uniref:polymeric immunoglobulin receptor-like n=1 Tax=Phyllobates terribilis TaxID=111132 RepID=UPI003CCB031C
MSFWWLLLMLFVQPGRMAKDLSTERTITGKAGEDITIMCNYDHTRFALYDKFWCRGEWKNNCEIVCESKGSVQNCHDKRMSISDNRYGKLAITMRNVVLEDGGTYWCGIKKQYGNPMILVNLHIIDVPKVYRIQQDMKQTVKEGEDVTIKCLYVKRDLVTYRKYLCQQVSTTQCNMLADTRGFLSDKYSKRMQIVDDNSGTISFIIKTTVFEDTGKYTCGVEIEKLHSLTSFEITVELGANIATTSAAAVIQETTTQCLSEVIARNFYNEWNPWRWIFFLLMCSALLLICLFFKKNDGTVPRRDASFPRMIGHL